MSFRLCVGNIWDHLHELDVVLVGMNSELDKNGNAIMGKGAALQLKQKWPFLPRVFGKKITQYGFEKGFFGVMTAEVPIMYNGTTRNIRVGGLQTKYDWASPARLELIGRSIDVLNQHASRFPRIGITYPGTGPGGLPENLVEPSLHRLASNITVFKL
jgi:hypothetical protein